VGCKLVQPLWEITWRLFKKLKIKLLYGPAFPYLYTYPKEMKFICQRDSYTLYMLMAALFTVVTT
jgi:hypothetical protein